MSDSWYYVEGSNNRIGPVDESEIFGHLNSGKLNGESYVWKKGFENWEKISNVPELQQAPIETQAADPSSLDSIPQINDTPSAPTAPTFSWENYDQSARIFTLKIGVDRGGEETEYGPFSYHQLSQAFGEKRINEKTYIFSSGMPSWTFLGDTPLYAQLSGSEPPVIEESDRRGHTRMPFIARLLFHDEKKVFEGICRDISIGGLQILVPDFPGIVGDTVQLNVHPDNSEAQFVAQGKIVRLLEGGQGFSLRFFDLSEEAQGCIQDFINE
jgi:hypothetical protein